MKRKTKRLLGTAAGAALGSKVGEAYGHGVIGAASGAALGSYATNPCTQMWGRMSNPMRGANPHDKIDLKLYEHPDSRAQAVVAGHHEALEVDAHGWEYSAGDEITIAGRSWRLVSVGSTIHTGHRGNYIVATARMANPLHANPKTYIVYVEGKKAPAHIKAASRNAAEKTVRAKYPGSRFRIVDEL